VAETINELVDRAVELGFISASATISASINVPDDTIFAQTQVTLQNLSAELMERVDVTLEISRHEESGGQEQSELVDPTTDPSSPTLEEENFEQEQEDLVEPTPEPTRLTHDEALQIALNFAEVTREQISDLNIELLRRGDRMVWEVDFEVERHDDDDDDDDWEFFIDAYTGEILYWERD
jgi:uncharacterized membrane protein YkoI